MITRKRFTSSVPFPLVQGTWTSNARIAKQWKVLKELHHDYAEPQDENIHTPVHTHLHSTLTHWHRRNTPRVSHTKTNLYWNMRNCEVMCTMFMHCLRLHGTPALGTTWYNTFVVVVVVLTLTESSGYMTICSRMPANAPAVMFMLTLVVGKDS